MKTIQTLVSDIYSLLKRKDGWFDEELARELSQSVVVRLREQLGSERPKPRLRLSQMGLRCPLQLWSSIHTPELAQPLEPWAEVKFSFGHILEAFGIALSKAAGHSVQAEQEEVHVDGITGHVDCILDGAVVDFKSASSRSFQKLKDGSLAQDDSFGYLDQLDGYVAGLLDDPRLVVKDRAYIFGIDKQLGHLCLYEHSVRLTQIRQRIKTYKEIVASDSRPVCTCGTVADGESGNVRLDVKASYSPYKFVCFPNLRTFLYSNGPRYLSKVVRKPYDTKKKQYVPEIDRNGNFVYN